MKKKLYRNFVVLVLLFVLGIMIGCQKTNPIIETGKTEIIEISTEKSIGVGNYSNQLLISEYYMILNFDETDLEGLRSIVQEYIAENLDTLDAELQVDEDYDEHETTYEIYFYRESRYLPRDWKPDGSFFVSDDIGDHNRDLVAYVKWEENSGYVSYYLMNRRDTKKPLVLSIRDLHYINNLMLNKCSYDNEGNCIDNAYPDYDYDGLSNLEEVDNGLNPYSADTDRDGISDEKDIAHNTAYSLVCDFNNAFITAIEISFDRTVDTSTVFEIDRHHWSESEAKNLAGVVSAPLPIKMNEQFEQAKIRVYFDATLLDGTDEQNLVLLWQKNGTDKFVMADTSIDTKNHSVSADISRFDYAEFIVADSAHASQWGNILAE